MTNTSIITSIFVLIILTGCSTKDHPNVQLEDKKSAETPVYKDTTEEQITALKAAASIDLGTTPREIVKKLRQVKSYADLLK